MTVIGMFLFATVIFSLSFVSGTRASGKDPVYIIATWGSLLYGLFLTRAFL